MVEDYKNRPSSELLDIILQAATQGTTQAATQDDAPAAASDTTPAATPQSDEILYFILKERLYKQLKRRYTPRAKYLLDTFDDCLDDFFLYLRGGSLPYHSLRTIQKKESFEQWLLTTFRNFLTINAHRHQHRYRLKDHKTREYVPEPCSREHLITTASQLIAYSHQILLPRNQLILLRILLTILNKSNALPDNEIADAMGMSYILYRVTVHRIMRKIGYLKNQLELGENPQLDAYHTAMAAHISGDFEFLYTALIRYYDATLQHQDYSTSITSLRHKYYAETGCMLHESCAPIYSKPLRIPENFVSLHIN